MTGAKKIIVPVLILVSCLAGVDSVAQQRLNETHPDQYRAINWSMVEGLSWNTSNVMLKDVKGFLWVGSAFGGLCRFDGAGFKKFLPDRHKQGAIHSDSIEAFVEDSLNNIWIGTAKGLSRYDMKAETFTNFDTTKDSANSDKLVVPFWTTSSQVYCLESFSKIIVTYDIHSFEKKILFTPPESDKPSINGVARNSIILDTASNCLWMAEFDHDHHPERGGLLRVSLADGKRQHYTWSCYGNTTHRHSFEAMRLDRNRNSIWINSGDGLLEFSMRDKQFHHIAALNEFIKLDNYDRYVGIDIDRKGRIWLATKPKGILIYDLKTGQVRPVFSDPELQQRTGEDNLHIYCDRDGIVWTSDYNGKGINELLPYNPVVIRYTANPKLQYSLSNHSVRTAVPAANGKMWIGTLDGLNIFDPDTEKFEVLREKDLPGIKGSVIVPVHIDTIRQKAWLSAGSPDKYFSMDVYEMEIKTRKCRPIVFREGSKPVEILYTPSQIKRYKDGLLVCDDNHGLFEIKEGSPFADLMIPFKSSVGRVVVEEDRFIFLQGGGVGPNLTYENKNGKWIRIPHPVDSLQWSCMLYNKMDQTHWVGTKNELVHYDKEFRKIKSYGEEDGYNGAILNMLIDDTGNLWFTNILNQIGRLNTMTSIITTISQADGFKKQDFGWFDAEGKDTRGNLYFCGGGGLDRIHPERYSSAKTSFAYLRSLTINQKPFPLSTGVNNLGELSLRYNQNTINFETGIIDYYAMGKGRLRYKLEESGKVEDWQYSPANYTIRYEGLPPGSYRLVMQPSNVSNEFNGPEKTVMITISPPIWKTWWAYTGYGFLIAGLLVGARRAIVRRERLNANIKLEHMELEKAREVDKMKSAFFANISHEFRTPLTLIKGPVQSMLEEFADQPKVKERLKMVLRNSDLLLKLINQLLDLAKLESGSLRVEMSEGDLNSFISAVSSSFSSFASQKNIRLTVDLPAERHLAFFDKDKLETILINLINNAIKFTPAGGTVSVGATLEKLDHQENREQLVVTVRDNGIGIAEEQQGKIFERFHQVSEAHKEVGTGIGLALVKELTDLLQGNIVVNSQPGEGSAFKVTLPIQLRRASTETEEVSEPKAEVLTGEDRVQKKQEIDPDASAKPHILVVEDNTDLRGFIIDSLGHEFHFLEAGDGKQGLEIATREVPDLIISDVMMPEMDGITMAGRIKKDIRTSHIPLILLTAKSTEDSKLSGLQTGADDYLTKPFNKNELLLKARNSIAIRSRMREKLRIELMSTAPNMEVLSADEQFLMNVKEGILNRLSDEQLSVESLSEDIGLSRVQLYRKVSALTGLSVNELIRTLRLQKAAQLLEQNWGPVSQVAYEVGFSNLSYFSKVFKEEYGVLPSEYAAGKM